MTTATERLAGVGRNAVARLAAQVWAKLLSFLLAPMVVRYAGAAALGRYILVLTVAGIAGAISDLGLGLYLTRETAQAADGARRRRLVGEVLRLKLVASGLTCAGLVALSPLLPLPPTTRRWVPLGALALIPDAALGTTMAYLNGRRRMDLSSGLLALVRTAAAVAGWIALWSGFGVPAVLWASVGANVLGAVAGWWLLRRSEGQLDLGRAQHRGMLRAARRHLGESVPFALTGIFAMLYTRVDHLLLGGWYGEMTVGTYGAAYRLWEAAGLLPASLLDALFPEFSRIAASTNGAKRLRRLVRWAAPAMGAAGAVLAAIGMAVAGWLLPAIYGADGASPAAVQTFRLLVGAIPAVFLYLMGGHLLNALGRQRRVTASMLAIALVNGAINLALIPRYAHLGASATMLLSEWLLCGLLLTQALRALRERGATEAAPPEPAIRGAGVYDRTARAFDVVAGDYDAVYGPDGNAAMAWMRQANLEILRATFPPGTRLLEIGCGTGEEAVALSDSLADAGAAREILATDVSPGMAAVALRKARRAGRADRIRAVALPAGGLAALHPAEPFDGAYASFGALNCEPELDAVAVELARLIRPAGAFVCSVMGRTCLFEMAWYLLKGQPRRAFRRLDRDWQAAPVGGLDGREVAVPTRYLGHREIAGTFAPAFRVERVLALPLLLPPPYAAALWHRYERQLRAAIRMDRWLRERWPFRTLGDHTVYVLRRR